MHAGGLSDTHTEPWVRGATVICVRDLAYVATHDKNASNQVTFRHGDSNGVDEGDEGDESGGKLHS